MLIEAALLELERRVRAELAVCDAATPGPWEAGVGPSSVECCIVIPDPETPGEYFQLARGTTYLGKYNFPFIASARTICPRDLNHRLARLESTRERLNDDATRGWWCPACNEIVLPIDVTNDEKHEDCGYPVRFDRSPTYDDALAELRSIAELYGVSLEEV